MIEIGSLQRSKKRPRMDSLSRRTREKRSMDALQECVQNSRNPNGPMFEERDPEWTLSHRMAEKDSMEAKQCVHHPRRSLDGE